MNASKYAVSTAAAFALIGAIGFAYAQTTTPAPADTTTVTPPLTATPPAPTTMPTSPATPMQQPAPATPMQQPAPTTDTPAAGSAATPRSTEAPMATERAVQADRN